MGAKLQTVIRNCYLAFKQNGGLLRSVWTVFLTDDLKDGCQVGEDVNGNKYYKNHRYFYVRDRWMKYSEKYFFNYDATHIPPGWFGWMHHTTDYLPEEDNRLKRYPWMSDPTPNLSGTPKEYVPYTTTRPKITYWLPEPEIPPPPPPSLEPKRKKWMKPSPSPQLEDDSKIQPKKLKKWMKPPSPPQVEPDKPKPKKTKKWMKPNKNDT